LARLTLSRAAALALACALGCAGAPRIEVDDARAPKPWTGLAAEDDPRDFTFAVVSDRTGGHRSGVFERAIDALDLVSPAFVMSVGDLIEGGTQDPAELDAQWSEFDAIVTRLRMPFFRVPGNHDYGNPAMARDWVRRFGPSYYQFVYKGVLFLVLNSELFSSYANPGHAVEGGDTQEAQMRFVERALAEHRDARWTFVLLHQPFWDTPGEHPDWQRVEAWLGDRPCTVLAGHFHTYTDQIRQGREYITLATTGGGSGLRGVDRGEFDHVMLVSFRGARPVIANLLLDGVHGADVHTAAMRSLIGSLDRAVSTEPLRVVSERFTEGEQRYVLHNDSDRPITVRGRFPPGVHFSVSPREVERMLAPGAHETLAVQLRARVPVPVAQLTPSLAHWTVEAQGEHHPMRSESTSWVIPERLFSVREAGPVAVDGDLREWAPLRFALDRWPDTDGGSASASLRFDVRSDRDTLYFAFDVSDPTPEFSTARTAQEQDGITVELDARPDPARSENDGIVAAISDGTLASLLVTTLTAVEPLPDPPDFAWMIPPLPEGVRRAVRKRAGGYSAELAVPRRFLDERAGGAWERFRLNLMLQDYGPDGAHRYEWRPSRFGPPAATIRGAGTFVRME
jgi:Calcineurin-like phosphoesterase